MKKHRKKLIAAALVLLLIGGDPNGNRVDYTRRIRPRWFWFEAVL